LVKRAFQSWQREGKVHLLTRKVVRPSQEELDRNPRARSAKLRALDKSGNGEHPNSKIENRNAKLEN
jgi:16S rRNA (cytosine1402-N4)-methyltransferase